MRKTFPKVTENLMKKNKKIFCLLGDIGVFLLEIFLKIQKRILNMSTMEQSMIGLLLDYLKLVLFQLYIPLHHFLVLRAFRSNKN